MALFEFENGRLLPAQFGRRSAESIPAEILDAVCAQVLEIVSRPLFPMFWQQGKQTVPVDALPASGVLDAERRLTALDGSGQIVSVEVLGKLTAKTLVESMSRLGASTAVGWVSLTERYPGGLHAFRQDWSAFRAALPPRPLPGPRLILIAGQISAGVRPALDLLAESGVEVHELSLREMSNGRRFVSVDEVKTQQLTLAALAGARQGQAAANPAQLTARVAGKGTEADIFPERDLFPASVRPHTPNPLDVAAVLSEADLRAGEVPPRTAGEDTGAILDDADIVDRDAAADKSAEVNWAAQAGPAGEEDAFQAEGPLPLADIATAVGQEIDLVWSQARRDIRHLVRLLPSGLIRLADGATTADPNEAALLVSGRSGVDGWRVWHIDSERGPSLREAQAELRYHAGPEAGSHAAS